MESKRLPEGPPSDSDEKGSTRENKLRRKEILDKKKSIQQLIKAAYSHNDHLSSFPNFRHYEANGLSVELKSGRGDKLSSAVKHFIQSLLKANMEVPYGSEWPTEGKVKRREMVAPEARYIFVHETSNANDSKMSTTFAAQKISAGCVEGRGPLVGFVQYRFMLEEEIPVLYVYELQLKPHAQGKGLGKFLMQLIELIAQKSCMDAVVLTVQKANLSAMNFYTNKLGYTVSATSPSRVDHLIGIEMGYEILCKASSSKAKTI